MATLRLYRAMNWSSWGATSQDLQPLLPVTLPAAVPATATAAAPDVVIQARRSWMADGPHAAAHGACWTGMHSNLIVEPLEFPGVLGNLGTGPHEPEIDPVSGLEVYLSYSSVGVEHGWLSEKLRGWKELEPF